MSKTTTLHVHHTFCTFFCCPCTSTMRNGQSLSWLEIGNDKAINFTIWFWTRMQSLVFSSNLLNFRTFKSLGDLLCRRKSLNGCDVNFLVTFSLALTLSDRKVPIIWGTHSEIPHPKILVLPTPPPSPLCTRIWVRAVIGLFKMPLSICQSRWRDIRNALPVIRSVRWGPRTTILALLRRRNRG